MRKRKRKLLVRTSVLLAVLLVGYLAGGVVLAQASADFDLGCRAELTAGGRSTEYPGVGVRLHSSLGQWSAGRTQIQGSGIIVESGYILPVGQGLAAGAAASSAPVGDAATDDEALAFDAVFLPAIYAVRAVRFVRPCNWPWAVTNAAN